jgi:CheY-like chemotaxis protein/HPt (histidine-containing phosphotransfer) domain-containing protein
MRSNAEPDFQPRRLPSTAEAERERSLVLLIDDHPTNRLVLARQLALAGFACESAEDGEAGLARWREGRFSLVLTDLHMPKLDGYELTHAIRSEESALGRTPTPIIAITAAAMKGEAERCIEAGMDDFLTKPVTIPTLLERMQRWMPHVESSRQVIPSDPDSVSQRESLPVLDASVLGEISGGSAEVERDVLIDFLGATLGDLRSLQAAQRAKDAVRTGREAHKIKGASRLVGALALSAAAAEVEAAARTGSDSDMEHGVSRLMEAFERLQQRIEQRRDRPPTSNR